MSTVRKFELSVYTGAAAPPAVAFHVTRDRAENAADYAFDAGGVLDAQVWAIVDDGSYLVYRVTAAEHGILTTRLRSRLRYAKAMGRKQHRGLVAIANAGGQATEELIRQAMGRWATNSLESLVRREWIAETQPGSGDYALTELGRVALAAVLR